MKKRIFVCLVSLLLSAVFLVSFGACSAKDADAGAVRVYTLNGTTGFGMAKLMNDDAETGNYRFSVESDASNVTAALINGDADIAALPTNAAANLYNVTGGDVRILAVNTLGCLYLLTTGETPVTSMEDLAGKTVYVPAQNPAFIFTYLCRQNDLTPGTDLVIDSTSYAVAANLRDAVASGIVEFAVLPEPMVTIAKNAGKEQNVTVSTCLDLTAEWNKIAPENSLVQGCVVVRKDFLDRNPEKVRAFLTAYRASIEFLNEHPDDVAEMIAAQKIFSNAQVAKTAIPFCNVRYLDGEEMKNAMKAYLGAIYTVNPKAVGGSLPDDGFYYGEK